MDHSSMDISFGDADVYDDSLVSVEAERNDTRLTVTDDESYLSEVVFVKVLGKGGGGTAVLCRHKSTGAFVVDKMSERRYWGQTVSEVRFMNQVTPNKYFLSPLAHFKTRAVNYECHLIMEYFDGKHLLDFIRDKVMTFSDLQHILRQLGEAFIHMHSKGVIHLDIKPANILINDKLECKIIDFGLSVSGPEAEGKLGTEVFAAPEVIANKYYVNPPPFGYSCDYYSLGVTALCIATNLCHPHILIDLLGPKRQKYLPIAVAVQKVINPDGPDDTFYDLITCLIERNPRKRLNDETFLAHPFFSKEFKKQSGKLTREEVLRKIRQFDADKYRKNICRSEISTEFHEKVKENCNVKDITVESFRFVLGQVCQKYEIYSVSKARENNISFWSKFRQSKIFKDRVNEPREAKEEHAASEDEPNRPGCFGLFLKKRKNRKNSKKANS